MYCQQAEDIRRAAHSPKGEVWHMMQRSTNRPTCVRVAHQMAKKAQHIVSSSTYLGVAHFISIAAVGSYYALGIDYVITVFRIS